MKTLTAVGTNFRYALATLSQIIEDNKRDQEIVSACKMVSNCIKEYISETDDKKCNEISLDLGLKKTMSALKLLEYTYGADDEILQDSIDLVISLVEEKINDFGGLRR